MSDEFIRVADAADLPPGTLKQVRAQDHVVCLANIDGHIYAVDNHCPYARWPLALNRISPALLAVVGW